MLSKHQFNNYYMTDLQVIVLKFEIQNCLHEVMLIFEINTVKRKNDSFSCNLKATLPYLR